MLTAKIKPILAGIIIATSLSTGVLPAAYASPSPKLMEKMSFEKGKAISPEEERIISSAATKTLRHIAQARADIHDKDLGAAKTDLERTRTLLDIIKTSMPTTKIKDRIWVAKKHLEYEDSEEVMPDLVPIYASLQELEDFMPVKDAKAHLDKAKSHMISGDKKHASEELKAMDAALIYTEIDLPLATTRRQVASAVSDLEKNNGAKADKALKVAEDNVVFLSVDVDEPIVSAKSSLWEAIHDYGSGAYDQAQKDLALASGSLQKAVKSGDAFVSKEASNLLQRVKAIGGRINHKDDTLVLELDQLWRRTAALSDRAMDYMSTGWSRFRAGSDVKSNLIEGRLYLSYARIDQFYEKNAKGAKNDFSQAVKYLNTAAKEADNGKVMVSSIKKEIDAINHSVEILAKKDSAKLKESDLYHVVTRTTRVLEQI